VIPSLVSFVAWTASFLALLVVCYGFGHQLWELRRALPQDVRKLSVQLYLLLVLSQAAWTLFGVLTRQPAIAIPNGVGTALCLAILVRILRIRNGKPNGEPHAG
jgi:tryptophan-rich sensory protein